MRRASALGLSLWLSVGPIAASGPGTAPVTVANANTRPAGSLAHGVLTLELEARRTIWYPEGDSLPGRETLALGETSGPTVVPGPLVRVPAGTTVDLTIRNTLDRDTIVFHVPPEASGKSAPTAEDSIAIAPGEHGALRFVAAMPGNYLYRARTNDRLARALQVGGLMAGAIVIDSAGTPTPRDRVMVLLASTDSTVNGAPAGDHLVFSINGRAWPRTERFTASVGDTLRWRVINANNDVHPMHLHGFYFRVDAFTGPGLGGQRLVPPEGMVVTQRLTPFSAMSLTWVPERAGNWLFHCHFQIHVARTATPAEVSSGSAHEHHAMTGMTGLVMGIIVKPRPGSRAEAARSPTAARRLRLVAVQDSSFPDSAPSMRFLLEEPATRQSAASAGPGFSPPIVLERGKPVSIMVVNHLNEPTAVHWHGIELESYYDGVAGFGGADRRISPIIAPRDSFEARFTPPRAGTFIYHTHANEPRQHRAGLLGALIVVDSALGTPRDDYTVFLKTARAGLRATPVLDINGQSNPDTIVLHAGRPARLRLISLALVNPNAAVQITARRDSAVVLVADSLLLQWRPLAKDGADLPEAARIPRRARQVIAMGETYDFEFTPERAGTLRIEVRGAGGGRLLGRVPVRVEER
jgi:FtsP/CotA-like multicopper oxidase with cupredoxin domain